jgi:hypothetical protein
MVFRILLTVHPITRLISIILFILILSSSNGSGAQFSIGTIIDTRGMAYDSTTISMAGGLQNGSAALLYRDSQMTNGGDLLLTKAVSSSGIKAGANTPSESGSLSSQKVLSYNASDTGSHISAGENVVRDVSSAAGSADSGLACLLSSESGGNTRISSSSASVTYASSSTLQIATRSQISPTDLSYSVTANRSPLTGQDTGSTSIASSFTTHAETAGETNTVTTRSRVSGLFDLYTRAYHAGNTVSVLEETKSQDMYSSKTVAEHTVNQNSVPGRREEKSGTTVYADDILTNGGNLSETRTLSSGDTTDSQRIVTYIANGSSAMQTEERVVVVRDIPPASANSSGAVCVMAQSADLRQNNSVSQTVSASSILFGVDSARIASTTRLDTGNDNQTKPVTINYRADITSPLQIDIAILSTMKDTDSDGLFEDINGNGHLDLQDLVLLFKNFEGLSKSSYSSRFDYNRNGKMDLADLIKAFRDIKR